MTAQQQEAARLFQALHVAGTPLVLFNAWDAGSARAVADAGAKAIATCSWSVAAANGFADGENLSLEFAMENLRRIVGSVALPVTIDLEKVTVPTLVLHGDADGIVPFEGSGKRTHATIAGSELVLLEGAPHGCNASHAEAFNSALIGFLGGR